MALLCALCIQMSIGSDSCNEKKTGPFNTTTTSRTCSPSDRGSVSRISDGTWGRRLASWTDRRIHKEPPNRLGFRKCLQSLFQILLCENASPNCAVKTVVRISDTMFPSLYFSVFCLTLQQMPSNGKVQKPGSLRHDKPNLTGVWFNLRSFNPPLPPFCFLHSCHPVSCNRILKYQNQVFALLIGFFPCRCLDTSARAFIQKTTEARTRKKKPYWRYSVPAGVWTKLLQGLGTLRIVFLVLSYPRHVTANREA
jgi:hypothetical protein